MKKICVIGSLNIDMAAQTPRLPEIGESVFTETFDLFIGGGKGGNQAVAAARLGADTRMVGLLGDRFYGAEYLTVLAENGVHHDTVHVLPGQSPGIAYIAVAPDGSNMLFVYSGANKELTPEYLDQCWPAVSGCDIFLFQQEILPSANLHAMKRLAQERNKLIILDPAPSADFTPEYLPYADIITPNETEMAAISGLPVRNERECREACVKLRSMGAKTVLFKAGKNGAYLCREDEFCHIPAFVVEAVDSTAAGDTFNAGLACGLALELDFHQSIRLGHAAAGLSTTRLGAQSAMPSQAALLSFLSTEDPVLEAVLNEKWDALRRS